jgi:hypothetical protein
MLRTILCFVAVVSLSIVCHAAPPVANPGTCMVSKPWGCKLEFKDAQPTSTCESGCNADNSACTGPAFEMKNADFWDATDQADRRLGRAAFDDETGQWANYDSFKCRWQFPCQCKKKPMTDVYSCQKGDEQIIQSYGTRKVTDPATDCKGTVRR